MQQASCKDDTKHTVKQYKRNFSAAVFLLKAYQYCRSTQVFCINLWFLNSAFSEARQLENKKATTSSKAAANSQASGINQDTHAGKLVNIKNLQYEVKAR